MKLKSIDIALISVFAALFYLLTLLPGIPIIGGKGKIELAAAIAPIFGIVLGPWRGALAALFGSSIAWILPPGSPDPFSGLLILAPTISSLVAGLFTTRNVGRLYGWQFSSLILGGLIALWYLTWIGIRAFYYPIMHIAGLALMLIIRSKASEYLLSPSRIKNSLAVIAASYCGIVSDHMVGNLAFTFSLGWLIPLEAVSGWLKSLGLPDIPSLFIYVMPISFMERLVMLLIAAAVGIPLIAAVKSYKLPGISE